MRPPPPPLRVDDGARCEEVKLMRCCSITPNGRKIVTQILPAGKWWDAEAYHQEYRESSSFQGVGGLG